MTHVFIWHATLQPGILEFMSIGDGGSRFYVENGAPRSALKGRTLDFNFASPVAT